LDGFASRDQKEDNTLMTKCCSESDRRHGLLSTGDDENNLRARAESAQSLLLIEMTWLDGLGQSFPCFSQPHSTVLVRIKSQTSWTVRSKVVLVFFDK
jgi:hypothetical protein